MTPYSVEQYRGLLVSVLPAANGILFVSKEKDFPWTVVCITSLDSGLGFAGKDTDQVENIIFIDDNAGSGPGWASG